MSKPKSIYTARKIYPDLSKQENDSFPELTVRVNTMETAFLLLSSAEEFVLMTVFKHITDFARKQEENITEIKEKNLFELLLQKDLFIYNGSVLVKRFALYLGTSIIESINTLQDLDTERTIHIMDLCLLYYILESDDFCIEYLSVIINKCLDDPHVAHYVLDKIEYLEKLFGMVKRTENPDVLWHSLEALHKMLQVQDTESVLAFVAHDEFPIDRILCDLTNEFKEVRSAALKVIKILVADTSDQSLFANVSRSVFVLKQLTKLACENAMDDSLDEIIEVLATALRTERMTQIFFEQGLFEQIVQNIEANIDNYPLNVRCRIIAIFAEIAQYSQFLHRLHGAHITDLFLDCLLSYQNDFGPSTHVVAGLNRMLKFSEAAKRIVDAYELGLIAKLLDIMRNNEMKIKTREQTAEFLGNLLIFAFHKTSGDLIQLKISEVLGEIFMHGLTELSIDYILSLLAIIENLAQNNEYRSYLGESTLLTQSIALLLKNSFSAAILVNNIFRCLCTLIDEENVRYILIRHCIGPSIKRGLKSLANLVKTSVTNFIMQTTRFPEFVEEYIDTGILELLILHQKHAFCVATWGPAIESILSKSPSLKFCIRNHLSFTDSTAGNDFLVSKKKFDDFRVFQNILSQEVSPLYPVVVVNFKRVANPSELEVIVPIECLDPIERKVCPLGWKYCRRPGDPFLPGYLNELNEALDRLGLSQNPTKISRCIDFDNVAKRAKLIAEIVAKFMSEGLKVLDLNAAEECSHHAVKCHLKQMTAELHCNFLPIGMVRTGCRFERAILFKCLADQIGLPSTLQRSVDGRFLFNEVPLPVEIDHDFHCDKKTMKFMPWRMLRPTHIVDLIFNVGDLYPMQSRQALQYLRLY